MIDVQIKLNGRQIGMVDITRVRGGERPDSINTYEICLHQFDTDWHRHRTEQGTEDPLIAIASFKHRYGDGWPALLRNALQALADKGEI